MPCAVANSVVGLVVAWLPFGAALLRSDGSLLALTAVWGVAVTAYTLYRVIDRGYLPLAEPVARATGLHDVVGPGSRTGSEQPPDGRTDATEPREARRSTDRSNE
jgi:hypothetical protein